MKKRVRIQECYREFSGAERGCISVCGRWLLRSAAKRQECRQAATGPPVTAAEYWQRVSVLVKVCAVRYR